MLLAVGSVTADDSNPNFSMEGGGQRKGKRVHFSSLCKLFFAFQIHDTFINVMIFVFYFRIHDYSAILYLMYTATLVTIYLPIISLLQLKFQNQQKSPFETSGFFMNLSVVALCIATATSGVLFYINHRLQNSTMEDFSLVHYMILKGVFSFFGILTPVSLVLVLIIPNKLDWIRYVIICVLLGVVAISNFRVYKKLNDMEDDINMEAHQMV